MQKLNILIVSQYFYPEEFRVNDLAVELAARGHEVVVLTGVPNYPKGKFFDGYGWFCPSRQEYQGVTVLRVPLLPRGHQQSWRLVLNYVSFALFASIVGPWRCRGAFDVIFVYEPSPITVAIPGIVLRWFKKAPLLLWVQDLWPESLVATGAVHSRAILAAVSKLVRWIYRHCDIILVQSRGFIHSVITMGAERSRIQYFPNWAEALYVPQEREGEERNRLGIPQGFCLMFAGNIGVAQDFPTILSAMSELRSEKDFHLVVVGDGRMASWVREEIERRRLGHMVHLLGSHPVETMPTYFVAADAMLVTLKREPIFALTIPGKIQSYMACGRPIIAGLDGEGARVTAEARAGFVAPAEDAQALAAAIRKMMALLPKARAVLGRNAREYYDAHFDRNRLIDELEKQMTEFVTRLRNV